MATDEEQIQKLETDMQEVKDAIQEITHGESSRHDSVRISLPESTPLAQPKTRKQPQPPKTSSPSCTTHATPAITRARVPQCRPHKRCCFSHHRQPHASTMIIPVVDPSSTGPMSSRIAIPQTTTPFCHDLVPRIVADTNAKSVKLHAVLHRRHLSPHHQHHQRARQHRHKKNHVWFPFLRLP
ncbi:hypothetical protein FH972_019888 [Carpinus fangiana]|uniref:Uncharacterized protein n=1 Tax=Carpinus fangiana TaxID=176857 RepID=A0A5N6RUM4_9ROSI|nr:hypothetical protein FH972_019888 [Carpinus fangiana]